MTAAPTAVLLVAGLLLIKEAGLPVPVPGDLLVLGTGVAAASGQAEPLTAALLLVTATIVGGCIQFALLSGPGRVALGRLLRRVGLDEQRIQARAGSLGRGPRSVAIARMTPGVRIVAIPAAAFAGVPARAFVAGLAVGNAVFVGAHFALGFVIGEPAVAIVGSALGPASVAFVVLAAVGAIGWVVLARRRRVRAGESVLYWADAACPGCLVLAAASRPAAGAPAS